MREAKAGLDDAARLTARDHFVAERRRFVALPGRADKVAGIAAFKEKRAAIWRGA